MRTILTACFLTALGWEGAPVQTSAPVYVPHRVFDMSRETFADLAARRVVTVSILQLEAIDIDGLVPTGDDLKRADYLLYTIK